MIKLLSYMTKERETNSAPLYLNWFVEKFNESDFKGVEKLVYCFYKYCYVIGTMPSRQSLNTYIKVDAKRDIKKYRVETDDNFSGIWDITTIEEGFAILTEQLSIIWEEIERTPTEAEFKLVADEFLFELKREKLNIALANGLSALSDGSDTSMLADNLEMEISRIKEKYSNESLKDIDFMAKSVGESTLPSRFLAKTGLQCINADTGGIYTKRITTINGQPGGGKSRFAFIEYAYPVIMAGHDVVIYETEMSKEDVDNIIIAYHLSRINRGKYKIPDSLMAKYDELSTVQKELYNAAKMDLFSDRYGKLIVVETDKLPVEKLEMDIRSKVKVDPKIKFICIDYAGDFTSDYELANRKHKAQFEIITDIYSIAKKLNRALDLHFVCINQYNDNGIDAAYAGKKIKSGMCQGGHVVQRSTSYDLNLTFTEEQKAAGIRGLSSDTKSRHYKGFDRVLLRTDLSISMFAQISE